MENKEMNMEELNEETTEVTTLVPTEETDIQTYDMEPEEDTSSLATTLAKGAMVAAGIGGALLLKKYGPKIKATIKAKKAEHAVKAKQKAIDKALKLSSIEEITEASAQKALTEVQPEAAEETVAEVTDEK